MIDDIVFMQSEVKRLVYLVENSVSGNRFREIVDYCQAYSELFDYGDNTTLKLKESLNEAYNYMLKHYKLIPIID